MPIYKVCLAVVVAAVPIHITMYATTCCDFAVLGDSYMILFHSYVLICIPIQIAIGTIWHLDMKVTVTFLGLKTAGNIKEM